MSVVVAIAATWLVSSRGGDTSAGPRSNGNAPALAPSASPAVAPPSDEAVLHDERPARDARPAPVSDAPLAGVSLAQIDESSGNLIVGRAVDPDGRPAAAMSIELRPVAAGKPSRTETTGAAGQFLFASVEAPARYRLLAQTKNATLHRPVVSQPGILDLGDVVLDASASVAGVVVDRDGTPLRDCTVALSNAAEPAPTDASGRFRVTAVGAGRSTIEVRGAEVDSVEPVRIDVARDRPIDALRLVASKGWTLTGRVGDESWKGLDGVEVDADGEEHRLLRTTTGPDGTYQLVLPPGVFDVSFERPGFESLRIEQVTPTAPRLDAALVRSNRIEVVLPTGVARSEFDASAIVLRYRRRDPLRESSRGEASRWAPRACRASIDDAGRCRVEFTGGGTLRVEARIGGVLAHSPEFVVDASPFEATIALELEAKNRVVVALREAGSGRPARNVTVKLDPLESFRRRAELPTPEAADRFVARWLRFEREFADSIPAAVGVTDANGIATLLGVPPGRYTIDLQHPVLVASVATPLVVDEAADEVRAEFEVVEAGAVAGVVRSGTGEPAAGRSLVLTAVDGTRRDSISDEHGRYRFGGLPAGDYAIAVMLRGLPIRFPFRDFSIVFFPESGGYSLDRTPRDKVTAPVQEFDVRVAAGATSRRDVTVAIPVSGRLEGLVASPSGPIAGVEIVALSKERDGIRMGFDAVADSSGAFAIELPEGAYDVDVGWSPAVRWTRRDVVVRGGEVTRLEPLLDCAPVEITVVDARDDHPIEGAVVVYDEKRDDERSGALRSNHTWTARTDDRGRCRFECVFESKGFVRAGAVGFLFEYRSEFPLHTSGGDRTLRLKPGGWVRIVGVPVECGFLDWQFPPRAGGEMSGTARPSADGSYWIELGINDGPGPLICRPIRSPSSEPARRFPIGSTADAVVQVDWNH